MVSIFQSVFKGKVKSKSDFYKQAGVEGTLVLFHRQQKGGYPLGAFNKMFKVSSVGEKVRPD